jgi:hypothetical protein
VQKGKLGRKKAGKNISEFVWKRRYLILSLSSQSKRVLKWIWKMKRVLRGEGLGGEKVLWNYEVENQARYERSCQDNLLVFLKWDLGLVLKETKRINFYNEEFDPGSGWTLAGGLTHASRGATRGSNTLVATGARVSNTYVTYPVLGDSPEKFGLIPHNNMKRHLFIFKVSMVQDGHAQH